MDNQSIALTLSAIAVYKQLAGENVFKVRAFENAARAIEQLAEPAAALVGENRLTSIKGIGESLAGVIGELATTGACGELSRLQKEIPSGLFELLGLSGMGPKKTRAVWQKLGITTLGELEYACRENRLISLDGFGEKSQKKILEAIEFRRLSAGLFLYPEALDIASAIKARLQKTGLFGRVEIAGSLRRGKETVKDADMLVVFKADANREEIQTAISGLADNKAGTDEPDVIGRGDTKISIRHQGLQVDFRIIPESSFACAWQYFTGSKEHNTMLRGLAKTLGYKVNEYEIAGVTERYFPESEKEFYNKLGLDWIPPELREGQDEIEQAKSHTLPELVRQDDIKGLVHAHSNYSDGLLSIEELVLEAQERGYSWLGLSDHSQSARYAGGLSPEKLKEQAAEIAAVNKKYAPFHVFHGIESDIRTDGSLDYSDEILAALDFVIGAVHNKLTMTKDEATERLSRAAGNRFFTMLAHPSGRLLLSREGYAYDSDALLKILSARSVVLEHNCNPWRLDPDWRTLKKAARLGISISINPDLHGREGFDHMAIGLVMARKAGLGPQSILNCKTKEQVNEFFRLCKKRAGA